MPRKAKGAGQPSEPVRYKETLPFHVDGVSLKLLHDLLDGKVATGDLSCSVGLVRLDKGAPDLPAHRDCVITVTSMAISPGPAYLSTTVHAVVRSTRGDLAGLPEMLQPGTKLVGRVGGVGLATLHPDVSEADE